MPPSRQALGSLVLPLRCSLDNFLTKKISVQHQWAFGRLTPRLARLSAAHTWHTLSGALRVGASGQSGFRVRRRIPITRLSSRGGILLPQWLQNALIACKQTHVAMVGRGGYGISDLWVAASPHSEMRLCVWQCGLPDCVVASV